jgi:DNA-directed RNA polymerase subunit alpha
MRITVSNESDLDAELAGIPDITVEEMDFSQRTLNCLKRADVATLRDLVKKSEEDLECIPGFGKKAMEEVKQKLDERGLSLRSATAVIRAPVEAEH